MQYFRTLFIAGVIFCSQVSRGQECTGFVSSDAIVIKSSAEENDRNGLTFWICQGEFSLNTNDCLLFAESGTEINLNGNGNRSYIDTKSEVNLNANFDTVYIKTQSLIHITGNSNVLFMEAGVDVTDGGRDNQIYTCDEVLIDYSNISDQGCLATGYWKPRGNNWKIFPNPAKDFLGVSAPENWRPVDIDIYNGVGEKVLHILHHVDQNIHLSQLMPGIYILVLKGEQQVVQFPFVKY